MKITCVRVYDLEESIVASGLPMVVHYDENVFEDCVSDLRRDVHIADMDRAARLASAPDGSGHRTWLAGVLVSFNVTATNAWWLQFGRYHFAQIVSSQSKMHRLKQMTRSEWFQFHDKVFENGQELLKSIADYYGDGESCDDEALVYNCPMGLELTARVTTNYLQLRSMYVQRKNHKLQEWRDFCSWIRTLPHARDFITLEDENV